MTYKRGYAREIPGFGGVEIEVPENAPGELQFITPVAAMSYTICEIPALPGQDALTGTLQTRAHYKHGNSTNAGTLRTEGLRPMDGALPIRTGIAADSFRAGQLGRR